MLTEDLRDNEWREIMYMDRFGLIKFNQDLSRVSMLVRFSKEHFNSMRQLTFKPPKFMTLMGR
jgi:hypothetical protein